MGTKTIKFVILAAVTACLSLGSVGWSEEDPLITLSVQQTEMSDVLKFIAAQSGTSVVVAPDVSASQLTVDLQEVPLSECLDVILKPHGYGYRRIGKTIVVDKLEGLNTLTEVEPLQTKVFKLKYLNATDILPVVQTVLSGRGSVKAVEITSETGWDFAKGQQGGDARLERKSSSKRNMAKSSKTIVVKDVPEAISQVTIILDEIDVEPRQVEIQSYFVELRDQAIEDIGVEWGFADLNGTTQTGILGAGGLPVNEGVGQFLGNPALTTQAVKDLAATGLNVDILKFSNSINFMARLHAVARDEDVNVMSAPRVLTQENQEAAIMVGTRYPILTYKEKDVGGLISLETKLDYYESIGIQLNVVPQVCENGLISMIVHPVVSEYIEDKFAQTAGGVNSGAGYPVVRTREAETRLLVADGQTIALGGLINEAERDGVNKVPLLGDLPFIGKIFQRKSSDYGKTELVIFLTAHIITSADGQDKQDFIDRKNRSEKELYDHWTQRYLSEQSSGIDDVVLDGDMAVSDDVIEVPVVEEDDVMMDDESIDAVEDLDDESVEASEDMDSEEFGGGKIEEADDEISSELIDEPAVEEAVLAPVEEAVLEPVDSEDTDSELLDADEPAVEDEETSGAETGETNEDSVFEQDIENIVNALSDE